MKFSTWVYFFRESLQGLRRNGVLSFASISTMAMSLAVLAVFFGVVLNLDHLLRTARAQVKVVAFLKRDFPRQEKEALLSRLSGLPGVGEARYVTREEALERLKKMFGSRASLLEAVETENPLDDSVELRLLDTSYGEQVVQELRSLPEVQKVLYNRETVSRLHRLAQGVQALTLLLGVAVAAASVFIVSNAIRMAVFSRRREIQIMKLVGATDSFIRWPFLLEGAIIGLAGASLAAGMFALGYQWFVERWSMTLPFIPLLSPYPFLWDLGKGLVVGGALLGMAGSFLSVRRHLHV